MKSKIFIRSFVFYVSIVLLGMTFSCTHNENHPGYAYMPDMAYSEAYETYTPNPILEDSSTMEMPAPGTVPREMIPYEYERSFEGQTAAGKDLRNPRQRSNENLERGKFSYDVFCAVCHGPEGAGDGYLYTSNLFTARPTPLNDQNMKEKPDGEIYHVITMGSISGLMGAYGSQVKPGDRWNIVLYIRHNFTVND